MTINLQKIWFCDDWIKVCELEFETIL